LPPHIRSDAEFCPGGLCREAAFWKRKKASDIETAVSVFRQAVQTAEEAAHTFEYYQRMAQQLSSEVKSAGIKDVGFMGGPNGILVVGDWPLSYGFWRETEHQSDDPEVIDVIANQPRGGAFIRQEAAEQCRELLRGPVRKLLLLTYDQDWFERSRLAIKDNSSWQADASWPTTDEEDTDTDWRPPDDHDDTAEEDSDDGVVADEEDPDDGDVADEEDPDDVADEEDPGDQGVNNG
jgi:hypothetical protein